MRVGIGGCIYKLPINDAIWGHYEILLGKLVEDEPENHPFILVEEGGEIDIINWHRDFVEELKKHPESAMERISNALPKLVEGRKIEKVLIPSRADVQNIVNFLVLAFALNNWGRMIPSERDSLMREKMDSIALGADRERCYAKGQSTPLLNFSFSLLKK